MMDLRLTQKRKILKMILLLSINLDRGKELRIKQDC